jgi:hypothetical protein
VLYEHKNLFHAAVIQREEPHGELMANCQAASPTGSRSRDCAISLSLLEHVLFLERSNW